MQDAGASKNVAAPPVAVEVRAPIDAPSATASAHHGQVGVAGPLQPLMRTC